MIYFKQYHLRENYFRNNYPYLLKTKQKEVTNLGTFLWELLIIFPCNYDSQSTCDFLFMGKRMLVPDQAFWRNPYHVINS